MKQLYRNISFTGVSQLIYTVMAFILVPFIARYLKSDGYGLYNLATIIGFFFNLLSDMGVSTLLTVEVSKNKRYVAKLLAEALGLKLLLTLPAIVIILFYLKTSNVSSTGFWAILIFTISSLFASFSSSLYSVFRGYQRMEFETFITILDKFISVSLGIFFLVRGYGIHIFLFSFVIAEMVKFFVCLFVLQKYLTPVKIDFHLKRFQVLFAKSIPFGLSIFLSVCYNYTAILMLTSFTSLTEVGLYSAGFKFLSLATIIPTVLATAFLPQLSERRHRLNEFGQLFVEGIKYQLFFSIPMIPFVTLYADEFIKIIFGSDFSGSVLLLRVLVWAAFAQMTNIFFVSLYTALGKQKIIVYFQIVGLGMNLLVNYLWIRSHGSLGASIATVLTEWSILLMVVGYVILRLLKDAGLYFSILKYSGKIIAASSAMIMGSLLFKHFQVNVLLSIVGIIFVYISVAQATGAMNIGRMMQFFKIYAGRKNGENG